MGGVTYWPEKPHTYDETPEKRDKQRTLGNLFSHFPKVIVTANIVTGHLQKLLWEVFRFRSKLPREGVCLHICDARNVHQAIHLVSPAGLIKGELLASAFSSGALALRSL